MALRLKKDVQKASYYSIFLGAQEARGLRGSRVLLPAIPRLVERSNEQEPLKVTLQVSHKGLKIIQGSSKHFIPHSAITCSVQTEDIVACVLLLYNPATRCPLHVHAYRCDSEATAEALNQQLQILINRPENQKRFADLESRLGLDAAAAAAGHQSHSQSGDNRSATVAADQSHRQQSAKSRSMSPQSPPPPAVNHPKHHRATTARLDHHTAVMEEGVGRGGVAPVSRMLSGRFDIGSDTGTSTRESDCGSDEQLHNHNLHRSSATTSPVLEKATLFDDLAAELREKLNGNGPPLLLPPRDYDTVHRAKGNLAASELRRCQNQMIVGAGTKGSKTTVVSSRGSSGIGSSDNMAPSPERHDGQTSSDEDWTNDHQESEIVMQPPIKRAPAKEVSLHKPIVAQPTQYLYPREPPRNEKFTDDEQKVHHRSNYRQMAGGPISPNAHSFVQHHQPPPQQSRKPQNEESKSRRSSVTSREEDEVRPILMKTRPSYNSQRFREIFHDELPPTAPKPFTQQHQQQQQRHSQHFMESPEEEEIVQTKRKANVRQIHSREFETEETPLKFEKHFPRPVLIDRSLRDDPSSSDNRSYTMSRDMHEKPHDQKFMRSDSSKDRSGRGISPQSKGQISRESKYKQDYYEDDAENRASSTGRGTTSSLEKFMIRQSGPQQGKMSQKALYKESVQQQPPPQHQEKEVTYRPGNDEYYFERNPYREPESQPYRESIEKMLKSPVMRYNSFEEPSSYVEEEPQKQRHNGRSRANYPDYLPHQQSNRRYTDDAPMHAARADEMFVEMSKVKVSSQDRFRDAKEKFQQMERPRGKVIKQPMNLGPPPPVSGGAIPRRFNDGGVPQQLRPPSPIGKGQMSAKRDPGNMNSLHRSRGSNGGGGGPATMMPQHGGNGPRRGHEWSSEEDNDRENQMMREIHNGGGPRNGGNYREMSSGERYPGLDRPDNGRLAPAKSLGNLVKGYRHSYAEPQHNMLSRSSGRVGLAAVNPY